jgi:MoaD family protein
VSQVQIKLFAQLRELAKTSELVINIEKPTRLSDVLREISQSLNAKFNRYLFEEGTHQPKSAFTITINNIKTKELDFLIHPGDVMAILPPVGGGTFF